MISQKKYVEVLRKHFPKSDYHLDMEIIDNPPKEYIEGLFSALKNHKDYDQLKKDLIFDEEENVLIQVHERFHESEVTDLNNEERFFYPFMYKDEIKRIFNIKSSSDYLLRLRAEQVQKDIRLKRTFSKLKKKLGKRWNFTNYFESSQYRKYLNKLTPEYRAICQNIPHGTVHSSEANGVCIKTPFGNIIVLSYALREFLFYMNVFQFGEQLGMKEIDTFHSLILAMRIMLGKESLDFEIDSRGKLPKSITKHINYLTDWQMQFIIGHEYAHHYLNHLKDSEILSSNHIFMTDQEKFYSPKQICEFEADLNSIIQTTYSDKNKSELLTGAFLFFQHLHIYERVEEYLFPRKYYPGTHPEPLDRIRNLREKTSLEWSYPEMALEKMIKNTELYIDQFLTDYLPYNVETLETTGSIYLPNYKKKTLIDRIDI